MCHFIQLVVGDLITKTGLSHHETILQQMIMLVNCSEVRRITQSRCHPLVKTRWLSRYQTLVWLLSWEVELSKIDPKCLSKLRRKQFREILTRSNFAMLATLHKIIHPFSRAITLFERDDVTLCHVYPAMKALKAHFRDEQANSKDSVPKYAEFCVNALSFIQQRQHKLLDKDLLKATYWLTSIGCKHLSENIMDIPFPCRLHLVYSYPPTHIPLKGGHVWFRDISLDPPSSDTQEHDEVDYSYTGEIIDEDELEEVPVSRGWENQVIPFLTEYLVALIFEDLGSDIPESVCADVRHQVEELLQFFFCNPDTIAKCQLRNSSILTEVELWNWVKYMIPGRICDQVVAKVISIISIPASEASCERSFSRQKRIMGHLRTTSNCDLLRARYLLAASDL